MARDLRLAPVANSASIGSVTRRVPAAFHILRSMSNQRRFSQLCLLIGLATFAASCSPEAGQFSIEFAWQVTPPGADEVSIEAEIRAPNGRVTPSTPEISPFTGNNTLRFESVPFGEGLTVEVRFRELNPTNTSIDPNGRVLYFGRSAPFSLDVGDNLTVAVDIQLTEAPVVDGFLETVSTSPGRTNSSHVTLRIAARGVEFFEIAQDIDFGIGPVTVPAEQPVSSEGGVDTFELQYDLNARPDCGLQSDQTVANCDGERQIFIRGLRSGLRSRTLRTAIRLDTVPPTALRGSVRYLPATENVIGLVTTPTAATGAADPGRTEVFVNVTFSEDIDTQGAAPSLIARNGASTISFQPVGPLGDAANAVEFSSTIDSDVHPDGRYDLFVEMRDLAGNQAVDEVPVPGAVVVTDSTPDTLVVQQANVSYVRSPIGNAMPELLPAPPDGGPGYEHPSGPYFALAPADGLDGARSLDGDTFSLENGAPLVAIRIWADAERATLLKTVAPRDGEWQRDDLSWSTDTPTVWVTGIDIAGNESPPVAIQTSWWVGTTGLLADDTSPHELGSTPDLRGPQQPLPLIADRSTVAAPDGVAVTRTAEHTWSGTSEAATPPLRGAFGVAYDNARGHAILFSGFNLDPFNDTWRFDGRTWSDVTPIAVTDSPPARVRPVMVFDVARRRIVTFGGGGPFGGNLGDAWEWDGERWIDVSPSEDNIIPTPANGGEVPVPRSSGRLAYDAARGETVLFGGDSFNNSVFTPLDDMWTWDGQTWRRVTPRGGVPPERAQHAMAYDSRRGRVVLFGGRGASGALNDVWEWDGVVWRNVTPTTGSMPQARVTPEMVYDSNRGVMVLFGGAAGATNFSDTWEWNGSAWTRRFISAPSPNSFDDQMVFDSVRGQTLWFNNQLETWAYDGTAWRDVSALSLSRDLSPPASSQHGRMAYDSLRRRTVLFDRASTGFVWERVGPQWTRLTLAGGAQRPSFFASSIDESAYTMSYILDPDGTFDLVLAAGRDGNNVFRTWTWSGSSWIQRTNASFSPSPVREGFATAYDLSQQRVVLFGGRNFSGGTTFSETWETTGALWFRQLPPGGTAVPPARYNHAMAYHTARDETVMFGGQVNDDRTWEFNGERWLDVSPALSPSIRSRHAMAYDSDREEVILYGGNEGASGVGDQLDDVWAWDGQWRRITPRDGPAPLAREQHDLVYDSARQTFVLFGGEADLGNLTVNLNDTWELSPPTQSAVQIGFQLPLEVSERASGLVVRGFCGGTFDSTESGAQLMGWSNGSRVGAPIDAWAPLDSHDVDLTLAGGGLLRYPAQGTASVDEARSFIFPASADRPGARMYFHCRPAGPSGLGYADVALDYLEVRVRYDVER